MTIFLAHLTSFLIGYLMLNLILKNTDPKSASLLPILSFAIGIGCSSLLTFFSFLLFNGYNRWGILTFNYGFLFCLLLFHLLIKSDSIYHHLKYLFNLKLLRFSTIFLWVLWAGLLPVIHFFATTHPFGEWDAWALWNMKMKFLILSDHSWKDIFTKLHFHTQPDYPILLPLFNVWVYAVSQVKFQAISFWTAIILSLSTIVLLFYGLRRFVKQRVAILGSLILLFHPFYIFLSTAQYADILLALYLLASIITLLLALREGSPPNAMICGLFLGLMTFTKNEGIVMTILLLILTSLYALIEGRKEQKYDPRIFIYLFGGVCLTGLSTMIFKIFLASPNRDILTNFSQLQFFSLEGLLLVGNTIIDELFNKKWSFLWAFLLILTLLGLPKFFKKECKIISGFFIIFFLVVLFIYLTTTNFDLSWRLASTLSRICFYILPSLLFFNFYTHWWQRP